MSARDALAAMLADAEKATPGPYFVAGDDASDAPDHMNSGLALVDTGRQDDWPVARLCEWSTARHIANMDPSVAAALIRVALAAQDWYDCEPKPLEAEIALGMIVAEMDSLLARSETT